MIKDLPNFAAWDYTTLAKFATDAYCKLQEQDDEIRQLKDDLRIAIDLYRKEMARHV